MVKAYEIDPSYRIHSASEASRLQKNAATFYALDVCDAWAQDWDRIECQEVSSRKYARARYAMGITESDYDV